MENKFDVNVEWKDDYDCESDWLGKYADKVEGKAYLDRSTEYFVNPGHILEKVFENYDAGQDFKNEIDDLGVFYSDYEDDDDTYHVEYYYHEELPYSFRFGRGEYRYIVSENFPYPSEDEYKYIVEDGKRLAGLERGDWVFTGCIVTVTFDGVEIARDSLWGIESDCNQADKDEVEKDLKFSVNQQAIEFINKIKNLQEV